MRRVPRLHKKPTYGVFTIDMLRVEVMVSLIDNDKLAKTEADEWIQAETINTDKSSAFAVSNLRRCYVWLGPDVIRQEVFHECWHVTHQILRELGASGTDEELNAHIHEFVSDRVLTILEKLK